MYLKDLVWRPRFDQYSKLKRYAPFMPIKPKSCNRSSVSSNLASILSLLMC